MNPPVPPEPEPPEPPAPITPTYTYDEKTIIDSSRALYTYIRYEGLLVELITSFNPAFAVFSDLFEKSGVRYPAYVTETFVYYLNGDQVFRHHIANNSTDLISNYSVESESPSGYLESILSGDYYLEEYQH